MTARHCVRFAIPACLALTSCVSDTPPVDSVSAVTNALNAPGNPGAYEIVDCLLPGQIRQLGAQVTYVTERRPVRTTKEDCVIRGGEYVAADRADYTSALKVWLGEAEKGSAEASTMRPPYTRKAKAAHPITSRPLPGIEKRLTRARSGRPSD
jgi:hypothetical protein